MKRCRGLSITPFARIPAKSHPSPSRLRASLYESKDSFSFAACSRLVVSSMPPPFHLHRITRPSIHSSHRNPPFSLAYRELTTCAILIPSFFTLSPPAPSISPQPVGPRSIAIFGSGMRTAQTHVTDIYSS